MRKVELKSEYLLRRLNPNRSVNLLIFILILVIPNSCKFRKKESIVLGKTEEVIFSIDTIENFKEKWNNDSLGCNGFKKNLCPRACPVWILEYALRGQKEDSVIAFLGNPDDANPIGNQYSVLTYYLHCKTDKSASVSILQCQFHNDTLDIVSIPAL